MMKSAALSAGDWIEVRSKEEILSTLDQRGQLEGLPFMPEMFELCGQRLRVFKRAHKTCDPPDLGGRRMERAVHLEGVRCDGAAHSGCQARCLVFWKEAWLKRVDEVDGSQARAKTGCTEQDVLAGTRRPDDRDDDPRYVCQATQLGAATRPQRSWDPRPYVEDYSAGNVRLSQMLGTFLLFMLRQVETAGVGLGAPIRWAFDRWQRFRGAAVYPWRVGGVRKGGKTPARRLNLEPGELVRVKRYDEILKTLDEEGVNRGMKFDAEQVPYCGGTYRTLARVNRIIDERTGKMRSINNDCIILEDVVCRACYAKYRWFCSRSIYSYWREIWLERLDATR